MLSLYPRGVLDEIWDLIESVSEGFPTSIPFFSLFGLDAESRSIGQVFLSPLSGHNRGFGVS